MKRALLVLLIAVSNFTYSTAQVFDVDTIQYHGDASKFFNLVILGDGYTNSELDTFVTDAQNFTNDFFSVVPFSHYQSYFNVFAIKVPSNQSGASHPGTAVDVTEPVSPVRTVDNYFGSTFDAFGIHRLLVATETSKIMLALADNFPLYDQAIILVNSTEYGGSGGEFPVASLNEFSSDIAIHELGHSIVGLKDEYYPGDIYAEEAINMTQDTNPATVRWKNWHGVDSIAIYQHTGGGNASLWYKPGNHCKMEIVDSAFCHVCVEGIIERLHTLIDPVISYSPAALNLDTASLPLSFSMDLMKPAPNTLKRKWTLNGGDFASNVDTVQLTAGELLTGVNLLSVFIEDTTALLRVDDHQNVHVNVVTWTISTYPVGVDIKSVENEIELKLFPNPVTSDLNVEVRTTLQEKLKLELYDAAGKRLKTVALRDELTSISLNDVPPGAIFVKLFAGKQAILTRQLLKL